MGRGEEGGRSMASEVLPLPVGRSSMGTVSLGEDMAIACEDMAIACESMDITLPFAAGSGMG